MKIDVTLNEGQELEASFNNFKIKADASLSNGGKELSPEPADYFFVSLALCGAFYARSFCDTRGINTEGLKITQNNISSAENKYQKNISLKINLPKDFPDKYKKGIMAAVKSCTVKKIIESHPNFSIEII